MKKKKEFKIDTLTLVDPLLCMFFCIIFELSLIFLSFFPLVRKKTSFYAETNYFDQGTACGAALFTGRNTQQV